MKKFLCIFVIIGVIFFTSCTSASDTSVSNTSVSGTSVSDTSVSDTFVSGTSVSDTSVSDTVDTISGTPDSLINCYCINGWNGNYFKNGNLSSEIKNGILYMNGESTHRIPDLGGKDNSSIGYTIVKFDEDGTWLFDQFSYQLEQWKRGQRIFHRKLNGFYSETTFVCHDNFIVARYGEKLEVLNLQGQTISTLENVVDLCCNDGTILISDFQHKNYCVDQTGKIESHESHYVRFRRSQSDNPEHEGANCYFYNDKVYFIDKEMNLWEEINEEKTLIAPLPEGDGSEFLWVDESIFVVAVYNKENITSTICIIRPDGTVEVSSQKAIDYNVAYDTLYFMEGNTIYSQQWKNASALPVPFFEGAYAVSPLIDESEGALVPQEKANWKGYGFSNIYSPYGEER